MTTVIHYVDEGEFYGVYGVTTLIVVILLLWYFTRTNITPKSRHHEGLNNPDGDLDGNFDILGLPGVRSPLPPPIKLTPDGEDPKYKLETGTYGDVPIVFFKDQDLLYANEWGHGNMIYRPNTRTMFMNLNTPLQKTFWDDHDQYIGVEIDGLTHLSNVTPN